MSTVSGLASKADKEKGSKQKYSSLNINNIFKGKSLENTKTIGKYQKFLKNYLK